MDVPALSTGLERRALTVRRAAFLLLFICLLAATGYGIIRFSGSACHHLFDDAICRVGTNLPLVALSFDDGPTDAGLDATLPVLARYGVKATFFVVGNAVARDPAQIARLREAGHEIGNHSLSHPRMIFRTPTFIEREVMETDRLLRAEGVETRLFRPPYFKRLWLLPRLLRQKGMLSITADVYDDARSPLTPEAYAQDMADRARPGSILLVHPMFPINQVQRDALPLLLEKLHAKGFAVVTVGELLQLRGE